MSTRARVAVLGGLGFIGSHLARRLIREGNDVVVFDKLYATHDLVADILPQVTLVEGDLVRTDSLLNAIRDCTTVYNLIHTTVPVTSMMDPGYDVTTNVAGGVRWMDKLGETKVKTLVYVSSGGTVYGPPKFLPVTEDHPTDPQSSYGVTKLMLEKYTALYAARAGITWRIARPANAYGPGQRTTSSQGIIGIALERIKRGEPVEVWGDGEVRRDYIHVDDLVRAIAVLGNYLGPETVFNVGTGTATSVNEIIDLMGRAVDRAIRRVTHPAHAHDVPVNVLDISRLKRETAWQPHIPIADGIRRLVDEVQPH